MDRLGSKRRARRAPLGFVVVLLAALYLPRVIAPAAPQDQPTTSVVATAEGEQAALATDEKDAEGAEVSHVLIALVIVLLAAKLGGELLERIGQPAVLGELALGVVIGNLDLLGYEGFTFLKTDLVLEILAEIGVILLLFEIGLETNLREMMSVGLSSFLVACLGVIAPFFLGWGVTAFFWDDLSVLMHATVARYAIYIQVFIGAVLCATSVGITARVLKDMGRIRTRESRIILGAAVIDDVLGLIVLAVCVGMIKAVGGGSGEEFRASGILWIIAVSILFFVGMAGAGIVLLKPLYRLASYLQVHGVLLTSALMICFLSAFVAKQIGLAPIVGAFAAGLILEDIYFRDLRDRREHSLEELLRPLTTFLTPIFFVRMGITVDLRAFGNSSILGFALALTAAAIIGKQICALGVLERGLDRISVGLGMIPRGEVGLIFASEGHKLILGGVRVIDDNILSACVIMIMITTLVTPPILKWKFGRTRKATISSEEEAANQSGEP